MSRLATIQGWVISLSSGFYTVQTEDRIITCQMRGKLKRLRGEGDIISVGDRVQVSLQSDGTGAIEEIEPRHSALIRLDPRPQGKYRQVLLANIDQIVIVYACANPEPHLRMLDRFLVIAEKQGIPPLIVANKVDLVSLQQAEELFGLYAKLGYPVLYSSVKQGLGVEELHDRLRGKISGFAGPSGVGKSSLLNAIQPELGLAVRETSDLTTKGRHTTIARQLFALNSGGYVADLPGLKAAGALGYPTRGAGWVFSRAARAGHGVPVQRLHPPRRARLRRAPCGRRRHGSPAAL